MNWFLNYWYTPHRESSFNLAVARVMVCSFAAWKVFAYPFAGIAAYPAVLIADGAPGLWTWWPQYGQWIGWEQGLACLCLLACAAGFATGLAAFAAAAIISHLTAIVWPVCYEKTSLPTVYFLLLYGLYRHEDHFVLRWSAGVAASPRRPGAAPAQDRAPLHALQWFLVTIAAIYFFAGLHKLTGGGWQVEWASPTNVARMLERRAFVRGDALSPTVTWLVSRPFLLGMVGWGTLVLELGLLVAVLANRFVTPCFLGLAAMHLGIWAMMGLNYFTDFGWMYLVFVPWDTLFTFARRSIRGP